MEKSNLAFASKVFFRMVLATVLGAILFIAVSSLAMQWCTEEVGYRLYELTEDEKFQVVGEFYFADGAPEEPQLEINQKSETLYSEMSAEHKTLTNGVLFALQLALLIWFIYPNMWARGDWDRNAVNFNRKEEDKLQGVKIGLLVAVPGLLFYTAFVLCHYFGVNLLPAYNIGNMLFQPYFALVTGFAQHINDITGQELMYMGLHLFILPLLCGIFYLLGYKQIFVNEKLIYKNNQQRRLR